MQPLVEHIQASRRSSFAYRPFELGAFPFRWHHHAEVELTLITRGAGQRFVGDSIERFGPGDLVLLGEHLPHTWHSRPRRRARVGSIVIQFRAGFLGDQFLRTPEVARLTRLLERAARGLSFSGDVAAAVAARMEAMRRERELPRLLSLLACLDDLSRCRGARPLASAGYRPTHRTADARRLDRVWKLVTTTLDAPVSQAEVAHALRMTPEGFSRFFKRATGRTFVSYTQELRVGEACRRLIETDEPVTGVCFASGFGNLSNFNRVFRRIKGVTPRAFRRAYRDADESGSR